MAQARHLSRAPITEALVDLRVKARGDLDISTLATVKDLIVGQYPKVGEMKEYETRLGVSPAEGFPAATTRDLGLRGFLFRSDEKNSIAQFRVDGFTFNKLKPYTSWQSIFPEAMRLWQIYRDVARPSYVTRIALRYINRLDVPPTLSAFSELLTSPLPIPPTLPQAVSRFVSKVTIDDPTSDLAAHVGHIFEQGAGKVGGTLILDIDAFFSKKFGPEKQHIIDDRLARLHDFKNRIFFESLTETAIREFT